MQPLYFVVRPIVAIPAFGMAGGVPVTTGFDNPIEAMIALAELVVLDRLPGLQVWKAADVVVGRHGQAEIVLTQTHGRTKAPGRRTKAAAK